MPGVRLHDGGQRAAVRRRRTVGWSAQSTQRRTLLDLLRWSATITLIWRGIEKFASPQSSTLLFRAGSQVASLTVAFFRGHLTAG